MHAAKYDFNVSRPVKTMTYRNRNLDAWMYGRELECWRISSEYRESARRVVHGARVLLNVADHDAMNEPVIDVAVEHSESLATKRHVRAEY